MKGADVASPKKNKTCHVKTTDGDNDMRPVVNHYWAFWFCIID